VCNILVLVSAISQLLYTASRFPHVLLHTPARSQMLMFKSNINFQHLLCFNYVLYSMM